MRLFLTIITIVALHALLVEALLKASSGSAVPGKRHKAGIPPTLEKRESIPGLAKGEAKERLEDYYKRQFGSCGAGTVTCPTGGCCDWTCWYALIS